MFNNSCLGTADVKRKFSIVVATDNVFENRARQNMKFAYQ